MSTAIILSAQPAHIGWVPEQDKFTPHTAASLVTGRIEHAIPKGWPPTLTSNLAWKGDDLHETSYVYELSEDEIVEIMSALRFFRGLKLGIERVEKESFPLPIFQHQLAELRSELFHGKGFFVIRGLEPQQLSGDDNAIVFLGISSYISGKRGRQTQSGIMLGHIIDADFTGVPETKRQANYSSVAQPFHSDVVCDVLAMYMLNVAAEGGKSVLSSTWNIYNQLVATRPDLIRALCEPNWVIDTFGQSPAYHKRALMHLSDDKVILNFSLRSLTGTKVSPRSPELPTITQLQAEALDAVQLLAEKDQLILNTARGDLLFINNLGLLHCREEFTDNNNTKRHLLRLWLKNTEEGWETPEGLRSVMDDVFEQPSNACEIWETGTTMLTADQVTTRADSCGHA